ncbi:MAG: hypothetical protein LAT84_14270 [Balneolia bacterium]|nr:hypothetical protein [Balneolia bacterium]
MKETSISISARFLRITLSVMMLWMLFPATLTAGCSDLSAPPADTGLNEFQAAIPSALMVPLADVPLCENGDENSSASSLICSLIPAADSECLTQAKALIQTDRHSGTTQLSGLQTGSQSLYGPVPQHSEALAYLPAVSGKNPPGSHRLRAPPFHG